ncbi:MAG: transposase family protein [Chloroflexota bacterium]
MRLSALIPYLAGFRLLQVVIEDDQVILVVVPARRTAICPICQRRSARIQSQYERTLVDLPVGERTVRLRLRVRRFRCGNRDCPRRVFAERFPRLTAAYARRTHAQRRALEDFGFEAGGSGGARLAQQRSVIGSRATILRLLHSAPSPEFETPRVLGVDDWARKRGQTYG